MSLSNAEKQRRFRQKKKENPEETKLVCYLQNSTAFSLRCLTKHHGLTQAEVLTHLIEKADDALLAALVDDPEATEAYIQGGVRPLPKDRREATQKRQK